MLKSDQRSYNLSVQTASNSTIGYLALTDVINIDAGT